MAQLQVLDDVTWDGRPVPGERTHALLRALAEAGHRGLSEEALVEEVWGDDLPANPTKALQVVVSRARSATRAEVIERTATGYRLALDPSQVDAWALRPEGLRLAAEGRYADALPLLERAQALDPTDELTAALLRAEAAVRGVPAALQRYEHYRADLADTLGVDPSPQLRSLHQELLARDRPVRSGLRYDADRLIGREADVAALEALVRNHRLVSILGAGGLGKTRLANLLARRAEQPVVHVVELAAVTSPAGVAVEVADALGVRESIVNRTVTPRFADVLSRLVDALGNVPTLLVLDNCEHLVEAVADLVSALLARTPALTVLSTTRIPLGLAAERVYQLPELSLDDAVELFRERATAARPGVVLDADVVVELVMRLDGLPLAVELAAAKVRAMGVTEIARRLDNRFALLRGGSRDAPERHQTLLAVIDWSWNLLAEEERVALRRLSVFRDGFALDGASAVLGYDAVEVVTGLAEQSLVVVGEQEQVRYRLLETVREFGRMQLVDAGDDVEAEKRLREWATGLAAYASKRLYSAEQVAVMTMVRAEEGNLVDVLRRCLEAGEVAGSAVLFASLSSFWTVEGTHVKVLNLAGPVEELLLAAPTPPGLEDPVRACLSLTVTNGMIFRGVVEGPGLERLVELGPGDDPQVRAVVRVLLESGGIGAAGLAHSAERLLALADDPDPDVARLALMWAAHAYENEGDLASAREMAARALGRCDDADGPWFRALMLVQLASFAIHAGDVEAAVANAREGLPVLRELGADEDYTQTRTLLAVAALHEGRYDEAERMLEEISHEEGAQSVFGGALSLVCGRAELLLARGEVEAGLAAYAEAVELMRGRGIPGLQLPEGFEPWVMYPQSAYLAACSRHGRPVPGMRADLIAKTLRLIGRDAFIDVPILGCVLYALAAGELVFGDRAVGARLLAYADRFAFSRMLPTFDWEWASSLAEPAAIGPGKPAQLREEIHDLLAQLA